VQHRFGFLILGALLGATAAQAEITGVADASTDVIAAQVVSMEGDVLVNRGAGFSELTDTLSLNDGDRIALGRDATARIAYSGGCESKLSGGQVVTISASAACAGAQDAASVREATVTDIRPAQAIGVANVDTNPAFWAWAGLTGVVAILMIFRDEIFDFDDNTTGPPPPVSP